MQINLPNWVRKEVGLFDFFLLELVEEEWCDFFQSVKAGEFLLEKAQALWSDR